jgi:asparagine synthase (glutamine-hydrolysing)
MCGIVGIVKRAGSPSGPAMLANASDELIHRGPDGAGTWWSADGRVGLAHRRLAILELSASGGQPMHDASGRLHITFNGEIYNHGELRSELAAGGYPFRSGSDTEVILAAYAKWGEECLGRFTGMFVFALYDEARGTLFVARDRVGEKPVFYHCADGAIQVASELKALLAASDLPRRVDPVALDCYLAFGYVPGDACILHGVKKLPPAHAMTFRVADGRLRVWSYWDLPACDEAAEACDEVELVAEFESLLEGSVRRQLVADVPVGILLSGGVDSSLTTAMAARSGSRIKTFTISFPGYGAYDESSHARLVAEYFGTEHVELQAEPSTVGLLPALARQFDEPMADSSMIPTYLVSKLVREHCKVALGGDGGDELFGGYMHHSRLLWMQQRGRNVPLAIRRRVAQLASHLPTGLRGRNWLQAWGTDLETGLPLIASLFSPAERRRLVADSLSDDSAVGRSAESIRRARVPTGCGLLQRATRMDFQNYLPEDILVKVDRASMLTSLEVRAPWLDHRLVEFAFSKVPSRLKATSTARKILPKKLASRVLPPTFDIDRKQGFSIPLAQWLHAEEWGGYFRDVLLGSRDTVFNPKYVRGLLRGQQQGRSNTERLFSLVLFELWRREYGVSL